MKKVTAWLNWHLNVECPECKESLDLSDPDFDCEGDFSIPLFNNRWDDLKDMEIDCPVCDTVFKIKEVES